MLMNISVPAVELSCWLFQPESTRDLSKIARLLEDCFDCHLSYCRVTQHFSLPVKLQAAIQALLYPTRANNEPVTRSAGSRTRLKWDVRVPVRKKETLSEGSQNNSTRQENLLDQLAESRRVFLRMWRRRSQTLDWEAGLLEPVSTGGWVLSVELNSNFNSEVNRWQRKHYISYITDWAAVGFGFKHLCTHVHSDADFNTVSQTI